MAVVFSVGKPGKLVIKTHPGEEAPYSWISHEITGNSLYILRGSEHEHKSQACEDGEPGRRGVLVMFVKGQTSWPTTPAVVASKSPYAPPAKASATSRVRQESSATSKVNFEGAGTSYITVEAGMVYMVRQEVSTHYCHWTGPSDSKKRVKRYLAILSGHITGDRTSSEHDVLEKETFLSLAYHYEYLKQGVRRVDCPEDRKTVHIGEENQVRAEVFS